MQDDAAQGFVVYKVEWEAIALADRLVTKIMDKAPL